MKNINIKLNEQLTNRLFEDMDSECLEQVQLLVKQGATLDPLNGELVLNNIRTSVFTDYFKWAFFLDEDEKPHQDQKLVIASRRNPYGYGSDWQYICVESPDGSARAWDPNSETCYGTECEIYQFQIDGESYPIWFESRDAAIFTTKIGGLDNENKK